MDDSINDFDSLIRSPYSTALFRQPDSLGIGALAEVCDEPEIPKAGCASGSERCGAGADHRDDVIAVIVLANLLKRGAILRYKRRTGCPRWNSDWWPRDRRR